MSTFLPAPLSATVSRWLDVSVAGTHGSLKFRVSCFLVADKRRLSSRIDPLFRSFSPRACNLGSFHQSALRSTTLNFTPSQSLVITFLAILIAFFSVLARGSETPWARARRPGRSSVLVPRSLVPGPLSARRSYRPRRWRSFKRRSNR